MRKIREVLRLKFDAGLSVRKIAASLRISSGSAGNYLHRFNACGLTWPTSLSDAELERCLFPPAPTVPSDQRPMPAALAAQRPPHHPHRAYAQEPPRARRMDTAGVIAYILERRIHPQHGFRACLGILRLSKQHGEARLEAACQRALALGACSYKSLESILRQGLERLPLAQQNLPLLPDEHINLRGPGYYH